MVEVTERELTSEENLAVNKYNEQSKILAEINELKKKLSETDYKALKFAEGQLSAGEYEFTKKTRQEIRNKINALEGYVF